MRQFRAVVGNFVNVKKPRIGNMGLNLRTVKNGEMVLYI